MEHSTNAIHARQGTVTGMLLVFLANISTGDLTKTIILAATGAAVSFIVSFTLKLIFDQLRRRPPS